MNPAEASLFGQIVGAGLVAAIIGNLVARLFAKPIALRSDAVLAFACAWGAAVLAGWLVACAGLANGVSDPFKDQMFMLYPLGAAFVGSMAVRLVRAGKK